MWDWDVSLRRKEEEEGKEEKKKREMGRCYSAGPDRLRLPAQVAKPASEPSSRTVPSYPSRPAKARAASAHQAKPRCWAAEPARLSLSPEAIPFTFSFLVFPNMWDLPVSLTVSLTHGPVDMWTR